MNREQDCWNGADVGHRAGGGGSRGGKATTLGKRLLDSLYPDQELPYRKALLNVAGADSRALEIGAGSGVGMQSHSRLRGVVGCLVGIDVEPAVGTNPHLDAGFVADASCLPFPDQSFDLVFHRMVAEHLEDPASAIRECARVLKPGGKLVFLTPNRWYYASVIAALTPTWFHRYWIQDHAEHEVFPTFYRANTHRTIARLLHEAGLDGRISMLALPGCSALTGARTWQRSRAPH